MGNTLALLRNNWDAVNNQWNQWVLGYTQTRQRDLLNRMGLKYDNWRELAAWLATAIGIFLLAAGLWILGQRQHSADAARRLYDRFCRKLARAGVERRSYEGPRDFAARAGQQFGSQAETIHDITDRYINIRYADNHDDEALKKLRRIIDRFRPRTSS